jgi:hypothetical protein
MLTTNEFTYYQPEWFHDDGINVEYGGVPDEMFSFQAFRTQGECCQWLINHGYEPSDFSINTYHNDDIEGVVLIDEDGNVIPKIETFSDDEIEDMLTDEVLFSAGSIDNLHQTQQDGETRDQFMDRVYGEALDKVNDAIESIEESDDYDFSSYGGNPDTEWYDEARDEAVRTVMRWMLEEYDEEV